MGSGDVSAPACKCQFETDYEKAYAIAKELAAHGDVPIETVLPAVSADKIDDWEILCDCRDPDRVIAGGRKEKNDWYLVTMKNFFTVPEHRKKGHATEILVRLMDRAKKEVNPAVMAADITFDNEASKATFRKQGFNEVTRFCYEKGEPPADIVHFVRTKAENDKC